MKKPLYAVALAAALSLAGTSAFSQTTETTPSTSSSTMASKDIIGTAASNPDFSTLVEAVKAAELVETLSGAGPFTVFAPTNAAFEALPEGTLADLLKPENKAQLTSILTYHVIPGKIKSTDLQDGQKVKTVNGEELTVTVADGKAMINGIEVAQADIEASNGVIHVLGSVLTPMVDADKPDNN